MYDLGVPIIQIGAKKLCVWVHSRHKIIRMSSVTWARTLSMCALIAQRSIGTILHWRLTKHARRNVNFTTFSDDELFPAQTSNAFFAALLSLRLSMIGK